ncbi:YaaC family protein [Ornithinibacillus halophilus]|uniref:YaaC-like Protein n=1 Tax=Ornithinibacillus halophilus TaxID=930117 RepID=A0A1M5MV72_9BACI|nr:YaaC family protein [Ornithinibacillus halophilus]SHG81224.1 YaaC-like Protein [Ornithinibacillus halophilus]
MDKERIDSFYTYLTSQQTAQQYLYNCYERINHENAEVKSYENCNTFIYYLEHAMKYYDAGKSNDMTLKPVLLFYGMVHLLKAGLMTVRPDYPESTSLLAHGVSTRKRKKKDYSFLEDEVKIQHNGLFPYFSKHLYGINTIPFEKVTMESLLGRIPELSELFIFHNKEKLSKVGKLNSNVLYFPTTLLDNYHLTDQSLIRKIEDYIPVIKHIESTQTEVIVQLENSIQEVNGPFYLHSDTSVYFPSTREDFFSIPEVMVHYLLLYNLSMISRYESEWWGELLHSKADIDFPLVHQFIHITAEKIPLFIGDLLLRKIHS